MSAKPKVLIVTTHPIQYQVPWFRYLQQNVDDYQFEVLFLTIPDAEQQGTGFDQKFEWDIPLLEGYHWQKLSPEFLKGDGNLNDFSAIQIKHATRLIKQHQADFVFITGWQCMALIQIMFACKINRIPILIRGDSNNLKPRKLITKLFHRALLHRYDKFLAVGKANKKLYLDNGIREKDIYNCPHFVDNDFFQNQINSIKDERSKLRVDFNVPKDSFCFCFVGKLNPKKRILDILNAFALLESINTHLLVVGDGELMPQAKALVKKHQLNVSFAGFLNQSQISTAYLASDTIILASDYDETWGLVVNEAMASGIPAIVSDRCGCHPDLIIPGQTGLLFTFSHCDELAEQMQVMVDMDKQTYQQLCQKARQLVFENYSIQMATAGLVNALDNHFMN